MASYLTQRLCGAPILDLPDLSSLGNFARPSWGRGERTSPVLRTQYSHEGQQAKRQTGVPGRTITRVAQQ